MTMQKKENKAKVNISLDMSVRDEARRYAKDNYNSTLSGVITAMLEDFIKREKTKPKNNPDQGELF